MLRRYSNLPGLEETLQRGLACSAEATEQRDGRPAPRKRHKIVQRLDPATIAQLVAGYEAGVPSTELMYTYRLGKSTVLDLLHAAGVNVRRQGLSAEELAEAKALYAAGLSVVKVADKLGQPATTVYKALKRAGVSMRSPHDRGQP